MSDKYLLELRCPKCGSYESFTIDATCTVLILNKQIAATYNTEWDSHSLCLCKACGYNDELWEFVEGLVSADKM